MVRTMWQFDSDVLLFLPETVLILVHYPKEHFEREKVFHHILIFQKCHTGNKKNDFEYLMYNDEVFNLLRLSK